MKSFKFGKSSGNPDIVTSYKLRIRYVSVVEDNR